MSTDNIIDWFLWERYFAGTVTPTERAQIARWIEAGADRQETIQRIQAAVDARRNRPRRRDWHRTEAIETVLAWVRSGHPTSATTAPPRRPKPAGSLATARLADTLRHWFEEATELATAMLLDANEPPLSEAETKVLRDQINDRQREPHER